jgi:hypothetical protein
MARPFVVCACVAKHGAASWHVVSASILGLCVEKGRVI